MNSSALMGQRGESPTELICDETPAVGWVFTVVTGSRGSEEDVISPTLLLILEELAIFTSYVRVCVLG